MKPPTRSLILTTTALLGALFTLGHLSPARAEVNQWRSAGAGDWGVADNWSAGVPAFSSASGTAVIGAPGYTTGTALLASGSYTAIVLQLGRSQNAQTESNGYLRVNGSGTLADLRSIEIGGAGNYYSVGTLELGSGGFVSGTTTQVGVYGQGTLLLNGGQLRTNTLTLGLNAGGAGVLEIGGDGSGQITRMDNTTATAITGGSGSGTLKFTHGGNLNFANAISGANLGIEHHSGTTTLAANSSVKNLSVSGGLLNLGVSATLTLQNGSANTVSDGGALGGAGTLVGGPLTVEAGGRLVTTLTLANGITLQTGAVIDYVGNASGLVVSDNTPITIGNGILVDFSGVTLTDGGSYLVANFGDAAGGTLDAGSFTATGLSDDMTGNFTVSYTKGTLTFHATAVPEPTAWLLLTLGLGALILARHRK
ncbi:MAG: PEP-CTERM sorting domain-containing protein [Verrucomicrobiales bacterium]|jgi:hypothetical protein|nr:PEP-CTERM sorting domain-containing protein [Verrucomicrobiales bacterium]